MFVKHPETGKECRIRWRFIRETIFLPETKDTREVVVGTECSVAMFLQGEWKTLGVTRTSLHPDDQHCRWTGRKYALAKLMRDNGLNKLERSTIWGEFLRLWPVPRHLQGR